MLEYPSPDFKSRVFLFGADMNPITILGRWPNSRFVSIARADGALTQGVGLGANAFGPDVWGIIVETGSVQRGMAMPLTLADGTPVTAIVAGEPSSSGTPAEMLAEAHYWELPQAYRDCILAFIEGAAVD